MEQMNIFNILNEPFKFDRTKKIRLFEAFSGYGSQLMALKRLNLDVEVVGYSEVDKYAIEVYNALHGNHTNYGGIGTFDRLPSGIDICTWSYPCQDISLAGNQKGMVDGTRSNYGYEFLETVSRTSFHERPKILLMENVKALFSEKFKHDWTKIQNKLTELGYENYSAVLNAKDYGVAQGRERVFIVSILGGGYYEFPKPYKLEKTLKDYLDVNVDDKYLLKEESIQKTFINYQGNFDRKKIFIENLNNKKISKTITTNMQRGESQYVTVPFEIMIKTDNDESLVYKTKEADMPRDRIYDSKSIGWTITTNISQSPCVIDDVKVRKLTPRECFRLMDVSESDIDIILNTVSDNQAYKLAGNSIVVNVLVEIFKQMFD